MLEGWRGVAALEAEYKRVVRVARKRAARRISSEVGTTVWARSWLCRF